MYRIIKTYVKTNFQWHEVDGSLYTLEMVRASQNVRITVQWDDLESQDFFTLSNQDVLYSMPKETSLTDWVEGLDKGVLLQVDTVRGLVDSNAVDFFDLFDMASVVKTGNIGYGEGVPVPVGLDNDIVFSTDYTSVEEHHIDKLQSTCLFAVNGIIYPNEQRNNEIFIRGGNERLKYDKDQSVSVIDFGPVGTIKKFPINENNAGILPRNAEDKARNQTRFKLDMKEDIGKRIPILILDGYMHILNGAVVQADRDVLILTVLHDLAIKRCANKPRFSRDWIDHANLESSGFNIASFDVEKYVASVNTFIVLLDADDFAMFKEPVAGTDIPGVYHHYRVPRGMMFLSDGRLAPYFIKDYNEFECAIYTINSERITDMSEVTNMSDKTSYVNNGYTEKVKRFYDARLLEIYSFA